MPDLDLDNYIALNVLERLGVDSPDEEQIELIEHIVRN